MTLLLSSLQGASTCGMPGAGWGWDTSASSDGPTRDHRESQEEATPPPPPHTRQSTHSPCAPSAQTLRDPSSCKRTGPLLTTKRAPVPRWLWPWVMWWTSWRRARAVSLLPCPDLPRLLLGPTAESPHQALPWGPDCPSHTVVTLSLSVHSEAAVGICNRQASPRICGGCIWVGRLAPHRVCVNQVPNCDSVTLCVCVRV